VGDEIFVKIIDIDLDRRRISLSLKQANEGTVGEAVGDDFDPTLYGMPASYDEQGNYEYPEGFDPETGEWLPGYDTQRENWEHQYAEARARFEAHRKQIEESRKADEEAALAALDADGEAGAAGASAAGGAAGAGAGAARARSGARGGARSGSGAGSPGPITSSSTPGAESGGTLASDEALAALREKLSGSQS
jgi:small subunit ribosomal protein S1